MKNKKSQLALEFLMNYGWAILVVIVAIGALAYFGVLNPEKFKPEQDEDFICSHLTKIEGNFEVTYDKLREQQKTIMRMYSAEGITSIVKDGYSVTHNEEIVVCVIPSRLCYFDIDKTYNFCMNLEININVDRSEWEEWFEKE